MPELDGQAITPRVCEIKTEKRDVRMGYQFKRAFVKEVNARLLLPAGHDTSPAITSGCTGRLSACCLQNIKTVIESRRIIWAERVARMVR